MSEQDAYIELKQRVDNGVLQIIGVGGIPRGLTSIFTKMLGEGTYNTGESSIAPFDSIEHEPFLQVGNWEHQSGVYGALLDRVKVIENEWMGRGRDFMRDPVRLLIKNNSYHLTSGEWDRYLTLVNKIIISVRNPALTFLSISKAMGQIAVKNFPDDEGLKALVAEALQVNDFSIFDEGMKRHYSYHSILDHPEVQKRIWDEQEEAMGQDAAQKAARAESFVSWQAMVRHFAGTVSSNNLDQLPGILRTSLEFRRVGWGLLRELYHKVAASNIPYIIMDATDMQLHPAECMKYIAMFLGNSETAHTLRQSPVFTAGSNGVSSAELYKRVEASRQIDPPNQSSIPISRLPVFLQEEIRTAYAIYSELELSSERMRFSEYSAFAAINTLLPNQKTLEETDPSFAYARIWFDGDVNSREQLASAIRQEHPDHSFYFDAVDSARNVTLLTPVFSAAIKFPLLSVGQKTRQ